jgi:uncharacterized protein YceK
MKNACYATLVCALLLGCGTDIDHCTNESVAYAPFYARAMAAHDCKRGGTKNITITTLACGRPDRSITEWRSLEFPNDEATFLVKYSTRELLYVSTRQCSFGERMTLDDVLSYLTFDEYKWCQFITHVWCE